MYLDIVVLYDGELDGDSIHSSRL